jgi:hypothetical protein
VFSSGEKAKKNDATKIRRPVNSSTEYSST